ncbi:MAG: Rne/Rng family ribonuclease [Rickettsia sp.]|nr:Rne/Rng family ribonuclease [Rickettsia sp.]
MNKKIIIDANFPGETRICVLDKFNKIKIFESESQHKKSLKGNIYLAKITRVEPSLQAAFVDFGHSKSGFLPFSEISSDYYNIPIGDRKINDETLAPLDENNEDILKKKNHPIKYSENFDIDQEKIDIQKIEDLVNSSAQPNINISENEAENEIFDETSKKTDTDTIYKIQEVISKGNIVLIQVVKDEKGNKGPSLSTFISLAGKYCILMPNNKKNNFISKKISLPSERSRLRSLVDSFTINENNHFSSIIVRTAAIGKSPEEIMKDYQYLTKLWNKMRNITLNSKAPCFIHNEDNILLKVIRDYLDENVREVVIQGEKTYRDFLKFTQNISPNKIEVIKEYKKLKPILSEYKLEEQITKLYQSIVELPSGGTIVINPTEALISIDVNSGKYTNSRSVEEMALKNNVEASKVIANQVQLKNLSGLIVIDFIDMNSTNNRRIVERSLKEFFRHDRARVQISKISDFGLLEMSRQRLNPSFLELNTAICNNCQGKGVVRMNESNAMLILRTIENELCYCVDKIWGMNLFANPKVIVFILNYRKSEIIFFEKKYNVKLNFYIDNQASSESFIIEKIMKESQAKQEEISESILSLSSADNVTQEFESEKNVQTETIKQTKKNSHIIPSDEIRKKKRVKFSQ